MTTGALSDLKVVELGSMVSAPFCAKLLSSLGAEVIKIEKPGTGDEARRVGPFPQDIPFPETLPEGSESIALARTIEAEEAGIDIMGALPTLTLHYLDHEIYSLDELDLCVYGFNLDTSSIFRK